MAIKHYIAIEDFMSDNYCSISTLLVKKLQEHISLKVNMELFAYYVIESKKLRELKSFQTAFEVVTRSTNLEDLITDFMENIKQKMLDFTERDSGNFFFLAFYLF